MWSSIAVWACSHPALGFLQSTGCQCDPDSQEPAWNVATLEYTYTRESGGWRFFHNRCVSEHQMVSYANGWGAKGNSRVTSFTEAEQSGLPLNFERIRAAGGKQAPGKLTRSIRGRTVPTQEPE